MLACASAGGDGSGVVVVKSVVTSRVASSGIFLPKSSDFFAQFSTFRDNFLSSPVTLEPSAATCIITLFF